MAVTSPDDTEKIMDQWERAMAIWLPNLPDLPIQEWYHRIPYNQTYWKNWPTKDNAYVNGAFWHLTFQLVLNNLQPAQ
jgi:peptide/nickel transport system substrate-binding protein